MLYYSTDISKKNMILRAIWFSARKPTMSTFLRPLIDSIDDLYTNGRHLDDTSWLNMSVHHCLHYYTSHTLG